ncbi:MAG: hypothetical protein E7342_04550 [Clostridiales bacterium]|nr:hypothetical protein [Clostridiales bacterium]
MKKKFTLLFALIMIVTTIFAVGSFNVQAAIGETAKVDYNQLAVGYTLPTKLTSNLTPNSNAMGGGFYSTYNDDSKISTMVIKKDTDNQNYVEVRSTIDDSAEVDFIQHTSRLSSTIMKNAVVKVKAVFRPTKDFQTNATRADSKFILRLGGSDNTMRIGNAFSADQFDGETWLTYEKEFTVKKDFTYYHFITYAKNGHGVDIKSMELELISNSGSPAINPTSYNYDASTGEDLVVGADTKGLFIESIFFQGPKDAQKRFVTRSDYESSADYKSITFSADWLKYLDNGTYTFSIQISATDYTFTVTVTNAEPPVVEAPTPYPDTPDIPDTPTDDKGCGSVIGTTSAILGTILLAGAVVVLKKKR